MPARKLYFETVRVGDELPALAKTPVDRVQLSRYAGASGDFNPVHVDETYAKSVGMPSVYAPGMLIMGFLGQLVSDWARGGQLRKYNVKFIKIVWPGDTVVCKGRVTDRWGDAGRYHAEIDIWAENQKGELVLKGQATIQLFYSLEDENRQRSGQAPIVVHVPHETIKAPPPAEAPAPAAARKAEEKKKPAAAASKKTTSREKPAGKSARK
ncbi:MAG: MaoC family dehydratase [Myxococcaceae bacterium]